MEGGGEWGFCCGRGNAVKWETVRLGECVKFRSGGTPSKSNPGFWSGDIPWVSSGEMDLSRIYDTKLHLTGDAVAAGSRMVSAGAILAVVRGMSLAKDFRVARAMRDVAFNQDLKAIEPDATLDSNFLYWMLASKRNFIRDHATEASHGTKKLELDVLESLIIPRPPLPTQRRIAEILSAYDDLIENNQRRMKLLEESARLLYEEWFVRLRFPGHESTKIVKGVPEGWSVKPMGDVIEYYIGGGWGEEFSNVNNPVGAYVIRGTDIPKFQKSYSNLPPFRHHAESNFRSRKMSPGDIVFEVSGGSKDQLLGRSLMLTKGMFDLLQGSVIPASFCKLLRPKVSSIYLSRFLQEYYATGLVGMFEIKSTGISNYQFEAFLKYQTITIPENAILQRFEQVLDPIDVKKDALLRSNANLADSRDRLLTRLMSGKIDLESLDIAFPPSMQEAA